MSQENVDIVRRCMEYWARRDDSFLTELVDPDAVLDLSRNVFNPDVYRGYDGFRRYVEVVNEMWDDFEARPEEFVDGGDHVVVAVRISGKGRESRVQTEMRPFNVWTLRDSKVIRLTGGYRDRTDALEAAGLSE
jgi:ketosteroid isomerase-like protein